MPCNDMILGQYPKLEPRIIGLVGAAGSGKDSVANMIGDVLESRKISLASRFKEFAGEVFLFDENQLYGASEFRNAIDPRYSYDPPLPGWPIDFEARYAGFLGKFTKFLDWAKPKRIWPPPREFSIEDVERNRRSVWARYNAHETSFLEDVVPGGVTDFSRIQLRRVMTQILGHEQRNITPRLVLQLIGSEFGRAIDINIWANRTIRTAQELLEIGCSPIITDVRFLNEARRIVEAGGALYYLETPQQDDATEKAGVAGHASEKELRSSEMRALCDVQIVNDKSKGLDALRALVYATLTNG